MIGTASRIALILALAFGLGLAPAWAGPTLDKIKQAGTLVCGVNTRLTAQQRFTALQSGEIDILSRNTTYTLQRDAERGLNFAPVVFYDGQGFMVPKKLNVKSAKELNGATIC